jgi:hypothetical protein
MLGDTKVGVAGAPCKPEERTCRGLLASLVTTLPKEHLDPGIDLIARDTPRVDSFAILSAAVPCAMIISSGTSS